ncbi:MAG: hypothetical protein C0404_01510 [Verrucomicrobia bacterium]|nr:hypothetical protein [Verrucomicrobiota bacterium]
MKNSVKPVRKCHACPMNLGERCWLYVFPRGQWRPGRECRAVENTEIMREFEEWQKRPVVKTRQEIRRDFFRTRPSKDLHKHKPRRSGRW